MEENLSPELKDIIENIHRYCATHQNNVCFVWSFVGFKKDTEHKCIDCGDNCDCVDESSSRLGVFGDKETLQLLINELQEMIILEQDENGFVNL